MPFQISLPTRTDHRVPDDPDPAGNSCPDQPDHLDQDEVLGRTRISVQTLRNDLHLCSPAHEPELALPRVSFSCKESLLEDDINQ